MFIEKNWYNLIYDKCPFCFGDLERMEKKWNERATKVKTYFNCFNCDFWISEKKANQILNKNQARINTIPQTLF